MTKQTANLKTTPNVSHTMNLTSILNEVNAKRRRENYLNAFKFIGVCALVLVLAAAAFTHADLQNGTEMLVFLFVLCVMGTIQLFIMFAFLFWPFLLYFWGSVQTVRQRTLLTLIQTSVETNTPLHDIVRAYAAGCSSWYAQRLKTFADALESGQTLEHAAREHWGRGLFRYDIAGIIRLGGNDPETLRTLDAVALDERNFAPIQTYTAVRAAYLCMLALAMFLIMTFVFTKIVPQFEVIFRDFDTTLPALTTFVIDVSAYCVTYWYLVGLFGLLLGVTVIFYFILQTDTVVFRPWVFRRMFRSTDAAKFLMVFAVGIRRQFPIPAIVQMYGWTVPSKYLRRKSLKIQAKVESGGDWIDAVRQSGFINAPEASLLRSAQRTGNTAAVLDQLAGSKERLQIRRGDLFSKLAFMALIFLLGGIIGTFVIAMFLPLIELVHSLTNM